MWKLYGNVAGEPTLNVYALSVYVFTMVFSISRILYARGGYFRNFWVGMCRWEPETLNLYRLVQLNFATLY